MEARVIIDRLETTYCLPRDHPLADEIRCRLDRVVEQRLAHSCAQGLEQRLDARDTSIWLIRELDVQLRMDAGLAEELLSEAWGERAATSIVSAIARGATGDEILWFPDRAAFLTHFLCDFTRGQAWDKWYYREFEGLRSLPAGAAAVQALTRNSRHALATIVRLLERGSLEAILDLMRDRDLEILQRACVTG